MRNKGTSLIEIPKDYTVIDIETTGFSPTYDSIIEIGALKIRDNKVINEYQTLVSSSGISTYGLINDLTGISDEMLLNAPSFESIADKFLDFISEDILVGHNVTFDLNFLYDYIWKTKSIELKNDFWCTLKISRRAIKKIDNHSLTTMCEYFNIKPGIHRGLSDCFSTYNLKLALEKYILENYGTISTLYKKSYKTTNYSNNFTNIAPTCDEINIDNPFYNQSVCFTGRLKSFTRKEAVQILVNLGGNLSKSVNNNTNYLVIGDFTSCSNLSEKEKSKKLKDAEKKILQGCDLKILNEDDFLELTRETL